MEITGQLCVLVLTFHQCMDFRDQTQASDFPASAFSHIYIILSYIYVLFEKLNPVSITTILQLETTQIVPIGKGRNIDDKTCLM